MFNTFRQVLHDNWEWRKQSWNLAKIDLVKTYRGAALGWIWLFVKPAVYIGVYYFTFAVGMPIVCLISSVQCRSLMPSLCVSSFCRV